MGTVANILERLTMLEENDSNYGSLLQRSATHGKIDSIKVNLLSNSYDTLTCLVKEDVAEAVESLEDTRLAMEKVLRQARQLVQQRCRGVSGTGRAKGYGPIPSIDACIQGIERIVDMYGRETRVCRIAACEMLPAICLASGCIQPGSQQNLNELVDMLQSVVRMKYCVDIRVANMLIRRVKATIEKEQMYM